MKKCHDSDHLALFQASLFTGWHFLAKTLVFFRSEDLASLFFSVRRWISAWLFFRSRSCLVRSKKIVFSWHDSYFEGAFIRSLIKSCRTKEGVFMCCRSSGRVLDKQTNVFSDRSRLNYRNAEQRSILHSSTSKWIRETAIWTVAYILNAGPLLFRQTATDIFPKPLSWTLFK